MLKVIEAEQEVLVSKVGDEEVQQWPCPALFDVKPLSDGGQDQGGVAEGGQRNEEDAIGKISQDLRRDMHGQARLADTSGPGQRDQAYFRTREERTDGSDLLLTTNERREWCRQARLTKSTQFVHD